MILPSKHLSADRALLTIGAEILSLLAEPKSASVLWEKTRQGKSAKQNPRPLSYTSFVLTLDLLFMMGAVEMKNNLISRGQK